VQTNQAVFTGDEGQWLFPPAPPTPAWFPPSPPWGSDQFLPQVLACCAPTGSFASEAEVRQSCLPDANCIGTMAEGDWWAPTFKKCNVGGNKIVQGYLRPGAGFFKSKLDGNPSVFVIDMSGSMRGSRIAAALRELTIGLNSLGSITKFNVVMFSSGVSKVWNDVVSASPENIQAAVAAVKARAVSGSTNICDAITTAMQMPTTPQKIYFLADGEPVRGPSCNNKSGILERVRSQSGAIQINTVYFKAGGANGQDLMQKMAEQTAGTFEAVS